jgi:hypothetical protein
MRVRIFIKGGYIAIAPYLLNFEWEMDTETKNKTIYEIRLMKKEYVITFRG